jgi:hypothetical protein
VPNVAEQDALRRGRLMQSMGDSLRKIAAVWAREYGLEEYDAKTVQRILARHIGQEALQASGAVSRVSGYTE